MWKHFTLSLSLVLVPAWLAADKPQTTVRESAEVSLVEVPVNVVGRDGKPLSGLTAADFEVEDDGARQTIQAVDVIDLNRKAETLEHEPIPAAGRRHFLFLFDLSFSKPNQIVHARDAAVHFLERGLDPDDLAAVAVSSVDQGARLLVNFTSDRRQLIAAIRSVGLPRAEEPIIDPLLFAFVQPGDPLLSRPQSGEAARVSASGGGLIDPSLVRVYTVMAQKANDHYAVNRVERHLSEVDTLAFALNTVEGRKTIIYFSEGFNGRLLFGSLARQRSKEDTQAENDALMGGRFMEVDREHRNENAPLQRHLEETLTVLRRSDCTVYPIDIAGLTLQGDANLGSSAHGEDSLFAFANGTGGEVLKNNNDFERQMRRITDKTSLTYILTFRPTKKSGQGAFHRLKVKVHAKGAQVSARAGYYESRLFRALNPLERSLAAADVIAHEKKESGFPMELLAIALPGQPLARVPVVLEIPGEELLRGVSGPMLRLGLYVYAVGEGGEVADFFTRSVAIDLSKERDHLQAGEFRYCGGLRLLPGKYRLRAFVRDEDQGRYSLRIAVLDVPDAARADARALQPLFLEPGAAATGVSVSEPASKDSAPAAQVFELSGEGFLPRLRPGLAGGRSTRLCLMLYPRAGSASAPFQIDARVRDTRGNAYAPARFAVLGRSSPDTTGLLKLLVEFTPLALPPGDYSLTVTVRDPGGSPPAHAEAPFRIL